MKLGACQMTVSENTRVNLNKILNFLDEASEQGIDLLVFPEMVLTGYTPDVVLSSRINNMIDEYLMMIKEKIKRLQIAAIIGHPYKEEGKLFNRASAILPDGQVYTYDKNNLVDIEKKYFEPGEKTLTFKYKDEVFGVIICRDQNYPKLAQEVVKSGAKFLFILSAHFYNPKEARWKLEKNRAIPITRAVENGIYVLMANTVGSHLGTISLGNSLIVDPDGAVVVSAGESEEGILSLSLFDVEKYK
jgi:predicted amidohydrolase